MRAYKYYMISKFPLYLLVAAVLAMAAASCNSDSSEVVEVEGNLGNCAVTSFSLGKNDKVLSKLDSVFFSIDLVGGRIFNADSLPPGTPIDKLIVKIGTSSARGCDLTYRIPGTTRDTTLNYISSPNDSINFADGPVKLVVTSYDGLSRYEYSININVHTEKPDTLYWSERAHRDLPTTLGAPETQKTVLFGGKAFCLTVQGSDAMMAVSENPFDDNWQMSTSALPAGVDVNTLTASADALYVLDANGALFRSSDGLSWLPTGERMNHLYGGYGSSVLGARHDADGWKHVSYPAGVENAVPSGCPVSGTGQMVCYETKWSESVMAVLLGGRDASRAMVGSAWAYDGSKWAKISTRDIDEIEDVSLFTYTTPRVNANNWNVTERPALIAMGGRYETENGTVASSTVYVSYDQGLTWNEAASYLQFGEDTPGFYAAQALVFNTTLSTSRGTSDSFWVSDGKSTMPVWAYDAMWPVSRVSTPVTSWECPYIYLFGGYDASGALRDTVWRGVIRRFTFRPLY